LIFLYGWQNLGGCFAIFFSKNYWQIEENFRRGWCFNTQITPLDTPLDIPEISAPGLEGA